MVNTDQSKDDHGEEKPAADPNRPSILSFGDSNRTRSRGWDPTLLVRSEKSGLDVGGSRRSPIQLRGSVVLAVKL
ncbi:hypothetical protein U1Q18_022763 [Sarracenia purpurea var. burkii]